MLEFDNVCFQYDVDDYAIMDKLSFQIQDGEFVCVIGPSGCGKSGQLHKTTIFFD